MSEFDVYKPGHCLIVSQSRHRSWEIHAIYVKVEMKSRERIYIIPDKFCIIHSFTLTLSRILRAVYDYPVNSQNSLLSRVKMVIFSRPELPEGHA
jgi:hypothetical protein